VQRRKLVVGNISFLKSIVIIYLLIFSFGFSMVATSFITETVSADPNSYYVSIAGSDSYNGRYPTFQGGSNGPFKTIQKAVNVSTNGDTIYVMAGTYLPYNGYILIQNKNTANEWLTLTNYNDDYVLINGTNCPTGTPSFTWNAAVNIQNSKYVRVSGIEVNHSARGAVTIQTSSSHIIIDNCTLSNSSVWAIKVCNGMNNITAEHNYMYDNFNNWSGVWASQEIFSFENVKTFSINNNTFMNNRHLNIDLKGGCKNGEVCFNVINTSAGYVKIGAIDNFYGGCGIYVDARGVSSNISIYNNNIYGNQSGISLNTESTGHFEYIYVYNNLINMTNVGNEAAPNAGRISFAIANTGKSSDMFHHIYIYNNLVRSGPDNGYSIFQVGNWNNDQLSSSNLQYVYIVNNIFTTTDTGTRYLMRVAGIALDDGVFTVNNNSFYSSTAVMKVYWNTTGYTTSTPSAWGDDAIFTDPKFIDNKNQGGDFNLESDSPCIDTADDTLNPGFDFDGISRPQGTKSDRGAYEYISFYDTTPPQIPYISIVASNHLDTDVNYGWENISCEVTDNIAVSIVYIKIIRPNDVEINIEMTKIASSNYYYYNSTWSDYGNYSYSIWAIDTSDNTEYSESFYFSISPNWDINSDGGCGILDLMLVSNHYNEIGSNGWIREDVDNNGVINLLDMSLVSNHYGESWYT